MFWATYFPFSAINVHYLQPRYTWVIIISFCYLWNLANIVNVIKMYNYMFFMPNICLLCYWRHTSSFLISRTACSLLSCLVSFPCKLVLIWCRYYQNVWPFFSYGFQCCRILCVAGVITFIVWRVNINIVFFFALASSPSALFIEHQPAK